MDKELLKQIIADHKENYLFNPVVAREKELETNINYCFVGLRRVGKSYMMFQLINQLLEEGVPLSCIIYLNFEDERLFEITKDDLNMVLALGLVLAGEGNKPHFFLDEIQNVEGWEKFARRLADMKYHVCITGSNSKMLSSEIASTLGGRFLVEEIYPYSFPEYLRALGKRLPEGTLSTKENASMIECYFEYVKYGAFPELVTIKNKIDYLRSVYQTIYLGDILARNHIESPFAVRLILKKLGESVGKPLSFTRLTNIVKSSGLAIGKQTVINYLNHALDSYLVFSIQNYMGKLVDKETSPKYYFGDSGLLNILSLDCASAQLENLIAIELLRRYGKDNVFYFSDKTEVDFYLPEEKLAIQVSLRVLDNLETKERELGAFAKLKNFIPDAKCLLITNAEEGAVTYEGIEVECTPAWKFLLKR